jgi:hypothetical protein
VKVTPVPAQIVEAEAVIEIPAVKFGLTTIETAFDVAGEPVTQGVALEVKTQVTISPFAKDALV